MRKGLFLTLVLLIATGWCVAQAGGAGAGGGNAGGQSGQGQSQASGAGTASGTGATGGAATSGAGGANASGDMYGGAYSKLASHDRKFLENAGSDGQLEVQLGQMAQQKGSSQQVKDIGQKLVQDHSQANQELASIAQEMGVPAPKIISADDNSKMQKYSNLNGQEFDQQFIKDQIKAHQDDIKKFQDEAKNGKDEKLKSFAEKQVPILQQHLSMLQQAQSGSSASNR